MHMIKLEWMKCREASESGIFFLQTFPIRLIGKFNPGVGRPAMMYGSEYWTTDEKN